MEIILMNKNPFNNIFAYI